MVVDLSCTRRNYVVRVTILDFRKKRDHLFSGRLLRDTKRTRAIHPKREKQCKNNIKTRTCPVISALS